VQAAVVEVPCGCDTGSGLVILARSTIAISHCQTACKSRTSRTIAARRCDGREAASRRGVLKNFPQRSTETRRRRRRYSDAAASGRVNRCGYRHPPHVAAGIGTSNFTTQTRNILLLCRHSLNCKTLVSFCRLSRKADIFVKPHRMHAVHRCGLLLQTSTVAWSLCLCVLDAPVSRAKTSEPIEMPFWGIFHDGHGGAHRRHLENTRRIIYALGRCGLTRQMTLTIC